MSNNNMFNISLIYQKKHKQTGKYENNRSTEFCD